MIMNKRNTYIVLALVALAGSAFYFIASRDRISSSELVELKRNCVELAQSFAERDTGPGPNNQIVWKVLHTNYDFARESCFGEFDKSVYFQNGESFAEYYIYDLLIGKEMGVLTYLDRYPGREDWKKYYAEKSPEYYKLREEIFGLARDEF